MGEHVPIGRSWILIQDDSSLTSAEADHLDRCDECREFLLSFVSVSRFMGFSARFPTRDREEDRQRAA